MRSRGNILEKRDRVLVRILALRGNHEISNGWEEHAYLVEEQVNNDIPVYRVKCHDGRGRHRMPHKKHLLPIGTTPILAGDKDSEQDYFESDSILTSETSVSMPPVGFPVNSEALPVNSDNYHDTDTDGLHVEEADSTHSDFEAESGTRVKNDVGVEMVTDQCEEVNSALDSESSAVSINQSSSDSSEIGINENSGQ